ncbi:alpha/beta hydrolase [Rhodovulum imhoffii]|nr:alpha/beta hydrolase [Rhodovulum imhoffii]
MRNEEFISNGTTCRGVLYLPEHTDGPHPCIVMAHGFGLTHDSGLMPFKEAFVEAGYAVFAFDYRTFGSSDGTPRDVMNPFHQVDDYLAALAHARSTEEVDAARIALWGTSFAGGLVTVAAARDGQVQATISQCPMMDGLAATAGLIGYAGIGQGMRLSWHATVDAVRSIFGARRRYVGAAGKPGDLAMMTADDCYDGYVPILADNANNRVAAIVSMYLPFFRPVSKAHKVTAPALLLICEKDTVAPAKVAKKAAEKMPTAETRLYDIGHFDVYTGKGFEMSLKDQIEFLGRVLPVREAASAAPENAVPAASATGAA